MRGDAEILDNKVMENIMDDDNFGLFWKVYIE